MHHIIYRMEVAHFYRSTYILPYAPAYGNNILYPHLGLLGVPKISW